MNGTIFSEIRAYYEHEPEAQRLQTGAFQLEFARTKELIDRFLPEPPATILDIGGGAGAYSSWLAKRGYDVHLLDPVQRLVEEARELDGSIKSCQVGDARSLPYESASVEVILLLGPLYHLTVHAERISALTEAHRVLAPDGIIFAAAISRFASALDGLARDLLADREFSDVVNRDLASGIHHNHTENPEYFTTAKFHRPEELELELASGGFRLQELFGVEGPGWLFPDFDKRWRDARQREDLIRVARALEAETSVRGISAHLLAVAKRT